MQVLKFDAYMKEDVPEIPAEGYRIRVFTVCYFLVDDSMRISENKQVARVLCCTARLCPNAVASASACACSTQHRRDAGAGTIGMKDIFHTHTANFTLPGKQRDRAGDFFEKAPRAKAWITGQLLHLGRSVGWSESFSVRTCDQAHRLRCFSRLHAPFLRLLVFVLVPTSLCMI